MNRITIAYGTQATIEEIRTIWALITADPRTTVRCLKDQTGIRHAKVFAIIQFLEQAGYIAHDPRAHGRQVLIPFVTVEETNGAQNADGRGTTKRSRRVE